MAKLCRADGSTMPDVQPKGDTFSLKELYALIGNDCDCVDIAPISSGELLMVVDDEGLLRGLSVNVRASQLYGGMIAGNVVICRRDEID